MYQSYYPNNMYQSQQIIKVNGEAGARSFRLPANSSALLLDSSDPLVWLVQSDGAGYTTVTPYEIKPYTPAPKPDLNDIMQRLTALEGKFNESDIEPVEPEHRKSKYFGNNK